MRTWTDYQEFQWTAVRRRCAELVQGTPGKELTHEIVEQALTEVIPELAKATVEDDEFHELVTEVFADYIREGATDE